MYFSAALGLFLAALAVAAPSGNGQDNGNIDGRDRELGTFVMTEPDCPPLKSYCTHCNGDFNCETDPRCEWCYAHHMFN